MGDWTPGPWYVVIGKSIAVGPCPGDQVAKTMHYLGEENMANAHLIAAAPDMYDALRWIMHLHHGISKGGEDPETGEPHPITEQEWREALDSGKQALAKARGDATPGGADHE